MTLEEKIVSIICQQLPDTVGIYLFGSTGTEHETSDSDIDIAILLSKKIDIQARLALTNALIDATHRDKIDLIDLRNAPVVLKFQIIMNGRKLYCANTFRCNMFEMVTFSNYVRLNEERRGILEAVQKRGSIL